MRVWSTQVDLHHVVLDIPATPNPAGVEGNLLVHFWNPNGAAVTGIEPLVQFQATFEQVIQSLGGETTRIKHG